MKRICITGVNGYIGNKLAQALFDSGYHVSGIDKSEVPLLEFLTYYNADITDAEAIGNIFKRNPFDCVIHLAALVHKAGEDLSKEAYYKINSEASELIFKEAANAGTPIMLFASSIEVYGEQGSQYIDEETPCNPISFYGASKYCAEQKLLDKANMFRRYAVLRIAPVYADDFRMNLDKRFYLGRTRIAFYFKDGLYSFHFCDINTILRFVHCFIETNAESGIYNISDDNPIVAKTFLDEEERNGHAKKVMRLPYGLAYAGIAILEFMSGIFSKSEPFYSRYNLRKMFQSRIYSSKKAMAAIQEE